MIHRLTWLYGATGLRVVCCSVDVELIRMMCCRRLRQCDADWSDGRQVVQREGEEGHAGPQRALRQLHRESEVLGGTEPASSRRTGEAQGQVGQGDDTDQGNVSGRVGRGEEVS